MKKLLFLLLPLFCLAQDLKLDHSYTNAADFEVGDTITIKFNTIQVTEGAAPNLYMFDYEYNNKLLLPTLSIGLQIFHFLNESSKDSISLI